MRVPVPTPLRLDRNALLRDVRDRLSVRYPALAELGAGAPDPAWLLLEEAAWMVELLSEQMGQFPLAVVQQFVHMLGAAPRAARPAIGVVIVAPAEPGVMRAEPDGTSPWRFLTAQTESRDIVEFCPIEPAVPVVPARVASLSRLVEGQLWRAGAATGNDGLGAGFAAAEPPTRSATFDGERVSFTIATVNAPDTLRRVNQAIAALDARALGWLSITAEETTDGRVCATATVDPDRAWRRACPSGVHAGGPLQLDWAPLDGTSWTPPIAIADRHGVPSELRGQRPFPGSIDGTLVVPLPPQHPLAGLLERAAMPLPTDAVDRLWATLASFDVQLAGLQRVKRHHVGPAAGEPRWIEAALNSGVWSRLAVGGPRTVGHVELRAPASSGERLRVAWLATADRVDVETAAWAITREGALVPTPLEVRPVWALPVPGDRGLLTVTAVDVLLPTGTIGVVLATGREVRGLLANPVLVANVPVVPDRREVPVLRAVPEAVALLRSDLVTPEVLAELRAQPVGVGVGEVLAALPLARLRTNDGSELLDFEGVAVEATTGELTFNAPDVAGRTARLRPGTTVSLDWYRATDGASGNVEAGAIAFVEAPPRTRPVIRDVTNVAATHLGEDREPDEACLARVFGPPDGLPVLPTDWERRLRARLGARAQGWVLRAWSYPERTLVTTRMWPLDEWDAESASCAAELVAAGPEVLLVVLGPPDAPLADTDLDWARALVAAEVRLVASRVHSVTRSVVTRFWGLRGEARRGDAPPNLPAWTTHGHGGRLVDATGRGAPAPHGVTLLNAAIVGVAR